MHVKDFITADECREIAAMMHRKYSSSLNDRYFEASIRADAAAVYGQIVLRNKTGSFFYPVEGRLAYAEQNLKPREAGLLLLDHIDLYFEEYLRDGDVYLPIDWADYDCDGVTLQLKGQILNLEVEQMANDFLARHGINASQLDG